jgi:tRNA(Arg) A34 adenosine deaminase TadA
MRPDPVLDAAMVRALASARAAAADDDVPVGAVVVTPEGV